jgi:phosphoribosylformimino-5-aminoimidazole carboxamide ribotide isomerase
MVGVGGSRFELLPAIDLRGGRVVRLKQGDFERQTTYDLEPADVAREFAAAGARWLHVVDLDAARTGRPSSGEAISAIVRAVGERVAVEVAGGIRSLEAAGRALDAGAARVVVGTAALRDPSFVGRLIGRVGPSRVAIALDVRDGRAMGEGWTDDTNGVPIEDAVGRLSEHGATTFEVTAIARDGGLAGPDLELLRRILALRRGVIIASGGISSIDDLRDVRSIGCAGAILGRALYEGRIDLVSAILAIGDDLSGQVDVATVEDEP